MSNFDFLTLDHPPPPLENVICLDTYSDKKQQQQQQQQKTPGFKKFRTKMCFTPL